MLQNSVVLEDKEPGKAQTLEWESQAQSLQRHITETLVSVYDGLFCFIFICFVGEKRPGPLDHLGEDGRTSYTIS